MKKQPKRPQYEIAVVGYHDGKNIKKCIEVSVIVWDGLNQDFISAVKISPKNGLNIDKETVISYVLSLQQKYPDNCTHRIEDLYNQIDAPILVHQCLNCKSLPYGCPACKDDIEMYYPIQTEELIQSKIDFAKWASNRPNTEVIIHNSLNPYGKSSIFKNGKKIDE